ncbi:MAG: 3-methyl-2-oxobutanoate hydroxymethyltransferase, partial [Salinirussus sp.]
MTTFPALKRQASTGEVLTVTNAYDATTARLVDESDVDMILVGDSLGVTMLGYEGTDRVTLQEMIHHGAAVARVVDETPVIFDMPFGSFNVTPEDAVRNAIRITKETGVDAVKVEGGAELADAVEAISEAGMTVFGHVGVTPQTAGEDELEDGRFEEDAYVARSAGGAETVLEAATAMDAAGATGIFLVRVAREVTAAVTERTDALTIGIGSGPDCDAQMLALHDLLGLADLNPGVTGDMAARFGPEIVEH